ncbi:MAG: type II toxin-antitoxin system VapC family toxin [Candidatus Omnitrophica bacterium]|nr:type II toxin-antitoxin system VapC family toxin [Candidatus Omnitrophota bacterium]MCA9416511.1 type II toxin-antitoxin system VapC family toxin [Candidatus Omnitrophota bacterium]MCA9425539.1 type II toxin-antitoxin system VapC family toxin [Candidatus Omnitrophota bacterium]MCA9432519.1 type II toxin-antitoxin system VapC family toxin [Candidatus Omnitrophota bacterium]MCA9437291.1 type II toxin-antitoxin system VapC family toxin [Candidatus Omnitrophota bacterium]
MFILDTNTLIYYFKGVGRVAERLLSHSPKEVGIPTVVLYEIEVGIGKSTSPKKRREQLDELISRIALFPFGRHEALAAASIRVRLEKEGVPIGAIDNLIAGTVLANRGTLVTHNKKEFERVPGLVCEDWF